MQPQIILALGACLAVVALVSGWIGARAPDPRRGPRLVPWRLIMLLSAAGVVLLAAQLAAALGGGSGPRP